jgi:hypothetical protein
MERNNVIFRHGAEVVEPHAGPSSSGGGFGAFHGRAYRLGDNEVQSEVIEGASREPDRRQVFACCHRAIIRMPYLLISFPVHRWAYFWFTRSS